MGTTIAPHPAARRVAALVLLSLAFVPMGPAQAEVPADVVSELTAARHIREAAERHLASLTTQHDRLDAQLRSGRGAGIEIVEAITAARRDLRRNAVEAYIAGGEAEQLSLVLTAQDPTEIADRVNFTGHRVVNAAEAIDRFERLKRDNGPAVVALAQRLDALDVALGDARDALYQAAANEADAERAEAVTKRAADRAALEASARGGAAPTSSSVRSTASAPAGRRPSGTAPAAPVTTSTTGPPPTTTLPDTASVPASFTAPGSYSSVAGTGPSPEAWAALRDCEAGGDYSAVSGSGRYRGAYQFDRSTWESLGGTGDPAAASPADQDLAAAVLYSMRGSRAWPSCGAVLS